MTTLLLSLLVFVLLLELFVAGILVIRRWLQPKGPFTISINDEKTIQVAESDKLLAHLYAAGVFIPSSCGSRGTCGLCRVQVIHPQTTCTALEEEHLNAQERKNGFHLACMVRVNSSMSIRVPADILGVREVQALVVSNTLIAPDITHLILQIPEDFHFAAGQYVQIRIEAPQIPRGFEFRAYSVASDPNVPGTLELAIRRVPNGLGSPWLHARQPGDMVQITGPYGEWRLDPDPQRELLLVGGGVGVTPLRSILYAATRIPHKRVHFYFGVRTQQDLFWEKEWESFQKRFPHWKLICALSHEPSPSSWQGPRGFVHEIVESTWEPESNALQVFVCGPPVMTQAVLHVLEEKGISPDAIYTDTF